MTYAEAESLLKQTFEEVKDQHDSAGGRHFISTHWMRYANIIQSLPPLRPGAVVLEIGASIMSSVLKRRFGAEVHTAYHELEREWPARFEVEKIKAYPVELMRDPLPFEAETFDLILFDEVMEHFPLTPDFFLRQVFRVLKPGGQLIFSVPNFATYEHRLIFLFGGNPQDPMDDRFIYYSHHREPVMKECLDWVEKCGGRTLEWKWTDYTPPGSFLGTLWNLVRFARHLEFHKIAHVLFPSMRFYLYIRAERNPEFDFSKVDMCPPLAKTTEFMRKPQGEAVGRPSIQPKVA